MELRTTGEPFSVDTIIKILAITRAPTDAADTLTDVSAAHRRQRSMCVLRALGNDIDDFIDRVGAPDGAPWPADYFDAFNILKHDAVLERPINASKQRRIQTPAVNHHQHGFGELIGKAAYAYGPVIGITLTYLQAGHQPQNIRNSGCTRTANIFLGNDENCGRCLSDFHRLFRNSCYFDVA